MFQKSRVLQIRRVKGDAVVFYRKPFTTKALRRHRLSRWVNNMAVSTMFMMSLGAIPSKQRNRLEMQIIIVI
jgi:hypothetical protein